MRNDREVISPSTQGRFWDDCYPKLREGRRVDSVSDQQSVDDTWLQRSPKILAKSGPPRLCSVGIISWTGQTEVPARVLNTTGTRLVDLSATEGTSARASITIVRRWSFDTFDGTSKKKTQSDPIVITRRVFPRPGRTGRSFSQRSTPGQLQLRFQQVFITSSSNSSKEFLQKYPAIPPGIISMIPPWIP